MVSWFDPSIAFPSGLLRHWAEDFAENARGIYYADDLRALDRSKISFGDPKEFDCIYPKVLEERNIFIPSLKGQDWNSPEERDRRKRASLASSHAMENGMWDKSEFAWDADARNDIFSAMRADPRVDM